MSETEIHQIHRPMWNIKEKEMEDISTDSLQYIPYYDMNLNDPNTVSDFRIEINDRTNFFYPHKSYLEFSFNIVTNNAAGTPYAAGAPITIQNNAASINKRYEFMFDDQIVDYVDNPDISLNVHNLVYFSQEHNTIASQMLWYPDTVDNPNVDVNQANGQPLFEYGIEAVNTGMRKRWQITYNSTIITCQIPLKNIFGLFRAYDKVTKGIKMSVRLTKNDYNNILLRAVGVADGKINFAKNGIKWWMPRVKPNPSIMPMLTSKLSDTSNFMVPFVDLQVWRSNKYTAAANNQVYQIRTKRQRPLKVFVCFQLDDPTNANNFVAYSLATTNSGPFSRYVTPNTFGTARVTGDQTNIKTIFDHINLTKLRVTLNSTTQYPEQEYSTVFPQSQTQTPGDPPVANAYPTGLQADYARVYSEFLRTGLRDHGIEEGTNVSYDTFKSLYPIFAIDLSEKAEYFVEPESALIEIMWSNNTIFNYYMWVIIESEKSIEMSCNEGQMKILKVIE